MNKISNKNYPNIRALAAQAIFEVVEQGVSLSSILSRATLKLEDRDRALVQEICFGIMRTLPELNYYLQTLMSKPLVGKNRILHFLLLVGLYQIRYTRIKPHAAVSETVNAVNSLKRSNLKGLINGVLREFLREQIPLNAQFLQQNESLQSLHPSWLVKRLKAAYPDEWHSIIHANNQKPPMWIRINQNYCKREDYQQLLAEQNSESVPDKTIPSALRIVTPIGVNRLVDFEKGSVTVQDLSAQYAAYLLAPQNGEQILDLCAAPGGKTTHILEMAPNADLLAVDIEAERVKRIRENLARLNQHAEVIVGDGLTPEVWCKGRQFDRILLDAPCSATGVIRRHPDIKWLRRDSDIAQLASIQQAILTKIWRYLKVGGTLVYSTCSVLPDENRLQIMQFLKSHPDAQLQGELKQILPSEEGGDGFFYAVLRKR